MLRSWRRWCTSSAPALDILNDGIRSRWHRWRQSLPLSGSSLLWPPSQTDSRRRHRSHQEALCQGPSGLNINLVDLSFIIISLTLTKSEDVNPSSKLISLFRHCIDVIFPHTIQPRTSVENSFQKSDFLTLLVGRGSHSSCIPRRERNKLATLPGISPAPRNPLGGILSGRHQSSAGPPSASEEIRPSLLKLWIVQSIPPW